MEVSDEAIAEAVERVLEGAEDRAAERVLETVALREPARLAGFLERLFDAPNRRHLVLAWRAANEATIAGLIAIRSGADRTRGEGAELVLTHTCRHDVIERLLASDAAHGAYLEQVGLERVDGAPPGKRLRALTSPEALQIVFPPDLVASNHGRRAANHPTWQGYETSAATYRFGGTLAACCELCGDVLDHLITLDPVPRSFGLAGSTTRIELGCCLSCVFEQNGEGGAFYRHDDNGSILQQALDPEIIGPPELPSEPFVEQSVCLRPAGAEWQAHTWGEPGSLHRVGGLPSWVQDVGYERCEDCGVTMSFLLQLDSDLPTVDGARFDWANGGMGYVCWCDGCRISHVFIQNT
jgi:hypothetical protein